MPQKVHNGRSKWLCKGLFARFSLALRKYFKYIYLTIILNKYLRHDLSRILKDTETVFLSGRCCPCLWPSADIGGSLVQPLCEEGIVNATEKGTICPNRTTGTLRLNRPVPHRQLPASSFLHILGNCTLLPWHYHAGAKRLFRIDLHETNKEI